MLYTSRGIWKLEEDVFEHYSLQTTTQYDPNYPYSFVAHNVFATVEMLHTHTLEVFILTPAKHHFKWLYEQLGGRLVPALHVADELNVQD